MHDRGAGQDGSPYQARVGGVLPGNSVVLGHLGEPHQGLHQGVRRVWARPPEEFLSPRENLAAAGRSEPWRWVVGVSADGDRERVSLLHREYGEFDYAERSPGRPGREELIAKRILDYEGQLITIQVHADVAKVVLTTRPDGK